MAASSSSATPVSSADGARALEAVRNTEEGQEAPAAARETIERAISQLWPKLQSNPSYLMSKEEFAIFNYFRGRYTQGQDAVVAQRAVAFFWNRHRNANGANQ